jgi:hypothetical protein
VPGSVHRFLVRELIVVAQRLGYSVLGADAKYYLLGGKTCPIPPTILRHQPDIIGAGSLAPHLLIGEAKTPSDLQSKRTREQLRDFTAVADAVVLIAIPESAEGTLSRLLGDLGIGPSDRVRCIPVPEALFPDG